MTQGTTMEYLTPSKSSFVAIGVCTVLVLLWLNSWRKSRLLPPGPPRLPFIGNIHQVPNEYPWRQFREWSKQYGPIYYMQFGLDNVIMLGDYDTAHELLDKRSNIYSSRPRVVMGGECVSKGLRTILMPYGPKYREYQRLQSPLVNHRVSQTYTEIQDIESKQLLHDMLESTNFEDSFHRFSSSLIYLLCYGRRISSLDDPAHKDIGQVMADFTYAARVGTWVVDSFPILNYLPEFLAPWKRYAEKLHKFELKVFMDNMEAAYRRPSWNWFKRTQHMKEIENMSPKQRAYGIGVLYEAGSDTTLGTLLSFTMAMILYPEVMKKAQAQIDAVLGDRMPEFSDQPNLPYVDAIVQETLRWRPVTAGGIPHSVQKEDHYMGYRIPKDSIVIGNHWAIAMDDSVYEDASEFVPDRWVKNPDLPVAAWGFGRRVCPGQHIAKNSLFITVARLLWAFDIGHAWEVIDGVKQRCHVDPYHFTQGFGSWPKDLKASFMPRSSQKVDAIKRIWGECEKDVDVLLARIEQAQQSQRQSTTSSNG